MTLVQRGHISIYVSADQSLASSLTHRLHHIKRQQHTIKICKTENTNGAFANIDFKKSATGILVSKPERGVNQGCLLSPYLFVITVELLRLWLKQHYTGCLGHCLGIPDFTGCSFGQECLDVEKDELDGPTIYWCNNGCSARKWRVEIRFPLMILLPSPWHDINHRKELYHKDRHICYKNQMPYQDIHKVVTMESLKYGLGVVDTVRGCEYCRHWRLLTEIEGWINCRGKVQ